MRIEVSEIQDKERAPRIHPYTLGAGKFAIVDGNLSVGLGATGRGADHAWVDLITGKRHTTGESFIGGDFSVFPTFYAVDALKVQYSLKLKG